MKIVGLSIISIDKGEVEAHFAAGWSALFPTTTLTQGVLFFLVFSFCYRIAWAVRADVRNL